MKLKKINDEFYRYFDKEKQMLFTLSKSKIGVYAFGHAWSLYVNYAGESAPCIATFVTADDGHGCFKEYCKNKLWRDYEAIAAADKMVEDFISDDVAETPASGCETSAGKITTEYYDDEIMDGFCDSKVCDCWEENK